MLQMKIEEICEENKIPVTIECLDLDTIMKNDCDLVVTTVGQNAEIQGKRVVQVTSYINRTKIKEDLLDVLLELSKRE